MKSHTSQFKENIAQIGKKLSNKITYTIDNTTTILDDEQLNVVSPHYKADILKSVMKQLDIDSNVDIPIGTEINYQFGLKVGNSYEYLDYGNYIVYKSEKQEDYNSYKIVAYDKMLYSMIDYEDLDITYPITIRNYLQTICTHLGLTFASASDKFTNYDKEISNEMYLDSEGNSLGYTFRDVLDELAQATASTICINNNDELEIRYIDDAGYEKDVSGSEISITDGQPHKVKDLKLSKLSTQYTTTGKNIYNPSLCPYTVLKTSTGFSFNELWATQIIPKENIGTLFQPNTTYTCYTKYSCSNVPSTFGQYENNNKLVLYRASDEGGNVWTPIVIVTNKNATGGISCVTFTTPSDLTNCRLLGYSFKDSSNATKGKIDLTNFMIVKGTYNENTILPYEPYTNGPAPNPDFPQEVKTVKGYSNLFDASIIDYSSSGIVSKGDSNGNITCSGTLSGTAFNITNNNTVDFPTGKYAFSIQEPLPYTLKFRLEGTSVNYVSMSAGSKNFVINLSENKTKMRIYMDGLTTNTNINFTFKLMIVKSEQDLSYVPYGTNYISNIIKAKNIFDYKTTTFSDISRVNIVAENDTLTITTTVATTGTNLFYWTRIPDYLLENGATYTISSENVSGVSLPLKLQLRNKDGSNANKPQNFTIVYDDNYALYITSNIFGGGSTSVPSGSVAVIKNIQVEKSSSSSTYEQYQCKTIPIPLNNNFIGGISTYKDQLLIDKDGHCYLNKKIGKVVLDGSETGWNIQSRGSGVYRAYKTIDNIKSLSNRNEVLSNYFKYAGQSETVGNIYAYDTTIYLYTDLTSTNDFKTWLSTHNTEVYYVLATPQLIDLNYTVDLELFSGINYITNSENADMDLTYIYEFDTIDEDYFKDTKVDFGEKYGPINSIVLSRSAGADNINLRNEASILVNGLCELKIADNQIMNDNNRDECLQGIFDRLNGLEYYINDYASTGIMYYDLCDRYRAKIGNNTYECVMFNDEAIIEQGLQENIHTDMPVVSETEYQYTDTTDKRINQAYIIVNKQNATITSLASRTKTLENNEILTNNKFNDYTPLSDYNYFTQTVTEELTETYKKTEVKQILKGEFYDEQNNRIVSEIVKTASATFDENGMTYEKDDTPVKTTINEIGIRTSTIEGNNTVLFAGYVEQGNTEYSAYEGQTIVATENVIVKNYFVMPEAHSRIEKYGNGGGMFYV